MILPYFSRHQVAGMKLGQTSAGRYLQVIYSPDEEPGGVFVITAYELTGKAKRRTVGDEGGCNDEPSEAAAGLG